MAEFWKSLEQNQGKPHRYCNFCGKKDVECFRLFAGPSTFICDGCVELCKSILDESRMNFNRSEPELLAEGLDPEKHILVEIVDGGFDAGRAHKYGGKKF